MLNSIKCELYKGFTQLKMVIFLIVMAGAPVVAAIGSIVLKNTPDIINDPALLETLSFSNLEFPLHVLSGVVDLLIPVFIVILVTDSITEDYVKGTLKLPLITPIRREKVLVSKMIAIGIEIIALLTVLIASSYLSGFLFFESSSAFSFGTVTLSLGEGLLYTLLSYLLTFFVLMVFTMVVFLIALHFKSTGSIIAITVGLMIVTPLLSLLGENFTKLLITNYFKYFNMLFLDINYSEFYEGIGIIILYGIVSFALSYFIFKKKDILY